jgi:hypothetical protein
MEVLKLSVVVACKKLPLSPKNYFIVAETVKLIIVGLVMLGINLSGNVSDPTNPTGGTNNESIQTRRYP